MVENNEILKKESSSVKTKDGNNGFYRHITQNNKTIYRHIVSLYILHKVMIKPFITMS